MKRFIHFIFTNKNEKLVIAGLLAISLLVSLAILVPQLVSLFTLPDGVQQDDTVLFPNAAQPAAASSTPAFSAMEGASSTPAVHGTSTPVSSPAGSAAPSSAAPLDSGVKTVHLTALSVEKDLYVFVRDASGSIVTGTAFPLTVVYPDGRSASVRTEQDGSCYLNSLPAGQYTVSMNPTDGYSVSGSITATVNGSAAYEQIDQVEEIVEIRDLSEGLSEIKTNEEPTSDTITTIDYITSDQTAQTPATPLVEDIPVTASSTSSPAETPESVSAGGSPVLDSRGYPTYRYTYHMDDQGYLVDRNNVPTDVLPNVENGVLICGFRFNSDTASYETVSLFRDDNTPVDEFWIDAEMVLAQDTVQSGWQTENGIMVYYSAGKKVTGLKNIDGKLYFFDSAGTCAESVGIDVSFYNGNINWSAVKNAGIDFAIIRIGFRGWGSGAIYQDTCFTQNLRNAKAAGIKTGVYFYSTAVNRVEAIEEASICLKWLGGTNLDLPIFLDMEFSGDYPDGRQDKLSPVVRSEVCQAFCETVSNAGYRSGLYATQTFLADEIDYNAVSRYPIWMASFTDDYALPSTTLRYDLWQFTDFGKVAGVNGTVDFSVVF